MNNYGMNNTMATIRNVSAFILSLLELVTLTYFGTSSVHLRFNNDVLVHLNNNRMNIASIQSPLRRKDPPD